QWGEEFARGLGRAVGSVAEGRGDAADRALDLPLGAPGEPAALPADWLRALRPVAMGPLLDTLSITTVGLHTPQHMRRRAEALNLSGFKVADDPEGRPGQSLALAEDSVLGTVVLAGEAARASGLLVANAVRPFAHTGFAGAVFQLGCGLMDRDTKLRLHRGVRPSVDTPLCAGCGSCLGACIFDAIKIRGGRAAIDHELCVGCGSCMTACHLAGISPRREGGVAAFQRGVAEAAEAAAGHFGGIGSGKLIFVNFLLPIGRGDQGGFTRARFRPANMGALVGTDPVALDQAAWDLLVADAPQGLRQWSGFPTDPENLLDAAAARGLGEREYHLEKIAG
ncbi:hypothetical protein CSB20_11000, partial [bacterium DOLZORAL124_64_63]